MSEGLKYEAWLKRVCFQEPTQEAYDLAKDAWNESANVLREEVEVWRETIEVVALREDEDAAEISTLTQRLADVERTLKHRNAEIKSLASHLESALADKAPLAAALKVCAEYLKEGTIEDRPFHSDAVYATQQALSNSEENDDGIR